ncbi:MAG: NAD(P)/FAD-dependent oxidoreductase [Candidatus Promineifilaceae bacterium]
MTKYDAVVVGSGPNGLAAGITLAESGRSVLLLEGNERIGGGTRTAELTLPGFHHDVCSAVHPLGLGSPFFRRLDLAPYGLKWVQPDLPLAHPFDDGTAAALHRSIEETAETLGKDGRAYRRLIGPLTRDWEKIIYEFLGPLRFPRHPLAMARFGLPALFPAAGLAKLLFRGEKARGFYAGLAAHSILPMERLPSASFGLMLAMLGHGVGWPAPRGGSQAISKALAAHFRALGGEIMTGHPVTSLQSLPSADLVFLAVTPKQFVAMAGDELPAGYRRRLGKYRYGPGVFKLDWALSDPIPWRSAECRRAGTVHLGATLAEISASERAAWRGDYGDRPYVIVVQPSLFDDCRAPEGQHTAWAYCHVPNGSTVDRTAAVEAQIERFAPGFRDTILGRHTFTAHELQHYNPNYIGGDINGGVQDLAQLFTRPLPQLNPYSTPLKGVYLCSSSTPPGGGVHGMCGYFAAKSALKD